MANLFLCVLFLLALGSKSVSALLQLVFVAGLCSFLTQAVMRSLCRKE